MMMVLSFDDSRHFVITFPIVASMVHYSLSNAADFTIDAGHAKQPKDQPFE